MDKINLIILVIAVIGWICFLFQVVSGNHYKKLYEYERDQNDKWFYRCLSLSNDLKNALLAKAERKLIDEAKQKINARKTHDHNKRSASRSKGSNTK